MSARCKPRVWKHHTKKQKAWYVVCRACGITSAHIDATRPYSGQNIYVDGALLIENNNGRYMHSDWQYAMNTAMEHIHNDPERWGC